MAKGLSQEQLALEADITPAYLCQMERGYRNPTFSLLSKVCDVLEISLSDFFLETYRMDSAHDRLTQQILGQLRGRSEQEKSAILQLIKCAFKLQILTGRSEKREGSPEKSSTETEK